MYKTIMIVDGYNVINSWPELIALKNNLEDARDKLVEILTGYAAFKGLETIVVFDGHGVPGGTGSIQQVNAHFQVVYSKEDETADSYIEKLAYMKVREMRVERVYVVTSDWAEQMLVLGAGAYRITARELRNTWKEAAASMKEKFSEHTLNYRRQELHSRLSDEVARRLDEIRRGGGKC